MKVVSFSIKNYRSITKTNKLCLSNYTLFIGPNNEGKSNLLKALVTALNLISRGDYSRSTRTKGPRYVYNYESGTDDYIWERDIPFNLSNKKTATTEFTVEFELSELEKNDFRCSLRSKISANLSIKMILGYKEAQFDVLLKGRGKQAFIQKKEEIAKFIKERLDYQYIPCVRTADLSTEVVEGMISRALKGLERTPEYIECLDKLQELQAPIINKLQSEIAATVSEFIPDVKNIRLETIESPRRAIRRNRVFVDDGALTDLDAKGDGVKSLVAIALMRYASVTSSGEKDLVMCVEEPESHLHPKAIHGIRKVLKTQGRFY